MATFRMPDMWKDPRTGVLMLRRRVPRRYLPVADQAGGIVKITTGQKDGRAAAREWPRILTQWASLEAEWERRLNVVALTPERAKEVAAHWASWIDADLGRLQGTPEDTLALDDGPEGKLAMSSSEDPDGLKACGAALLEGCALEAASLAGITVAPETMSHLREAMRLAVVAAYRQASLRDTGIVTAAGPRWHPLKAARAALPTVLDAPSPARPAMSVGALLASWEALTSAKHRTVVETGYILNLLKQFVGHDDAAKMTRDDLRRWRDAAKAGRGDE